MSDYVSKILPIIHEAIEQGRAEGRAEAEEEFREKMLGALGEAGGSKGKKSDAFHVARKALKSRKPGKRTVADLEQLTKTLKSYITKHPGLRIEKIAEAMDVTTKDLFLPARKLLADKLVTKKGERRATAYYPKA